MKIWYALLILLTPFYLFAQNNLGPRLTAMGNNGAAVTDVWAIAANPAALCGLKTSTFSLSYTKHLFSNELSTQSFAGAIPFKNNTIGFGLQRYGFSEYNQNSAAFAYAKKFGQFIFLALKINYHQLKISNYGTTSGVSVDAGAIYQLNHQFTIGAFVNNPAKQQYNTKQILTEIPSSFNLGLSYAASQQLLIAATADKTLQQPVSISIGLDYKMFELLSLRGGLSAQPFKQYAGFGLNYRKFWLDMATVYHPQLGYSPQIALSYAL